MEGAHLVRSTGKQDQFQAALQISNYMEQQGWAQGWPGLHKQGWAREWDGQHKQGWARGWAALHKQG